MKRIVLLALVLLAGCAPSIPREALQLAPEALENRQMQTRRFDTADEERILAACAGLLQDTGFTIEHSETQLGMILGTKQRKAVRNGEDWANLALASMFGGMIAAQQVDPVTQLIRASVITFPVGDASTGVRVTFQRILYNLHGGIVRRERVEDVETYQVFFDKLSKAIFLDAHEL